MTINELQATLKLVYKYIDSKFDTMRLADSMTPHAFEEQYMQFCNGGLPLDQSMFRLFLRKVMSPLTDRITEAEKKADDAEKKAEETASDVQTYDSRLTDCDSRLTDAEEKLDTIEEGANKNVIETISVNGTNVDPIDKNVDIVMVQSDWDQEDYTAMDYIKNKPNVGTTNYVGGENVTIEDGVINVKSIEKTINDVQYIVNPYKTIQEVLNVTSKTITGTTTENIGDDTINLITDKDSRSENLRNNLSSQQAVEFYVLFKDLKDIYDKKVAMHTSGTLYLRLNEYPKYGESMKISVPLSTTACYSGGARTYINMQLRDCNGNVIQTITHQEMITNGWTSYDFTYGGKTGDLTNVFPLSLYVVNDSNSSKYFGDALYSPTISFNNVTMEQPVEIYLLATYTDTTTYGSDCVAVCQDGILVSMGGKTTRIDANGVNTTTNE